jgi:hypothetical protein
VVFIGSAAPTMTRASHSADPRGRVTHRERESVRVAQRDEDKPGVILDSAQTPHSSRTLNTK